MPLLKLKQALAAAAENDEIVVLASDAGAWRDIPAYIELSPHQLIEKLETDGEYQFTVSKGA